MSKRPAKKADPDPAPAPAEPQTSPPIALTKGRHVHVAFTDGRREEFLAALERTGNLTEAAKAVGIARRTVYTVAEGDKKFAAQIAEAREVYVDKVRSKIRELGVDGYQKPIWYQGAIVGHETVYSERLLELEAKRVDPSYRDKAADVQVGVSVTTGVLVVPQRPTLDAPAAEKPPDPEET